MPIVFPVSLSVVILHVRLPQLDSKLKQLPALRLLLTRSQSVTSTMTDEVTLLGSLFAVSLSDKQPIAAITGLADGLDTQTHYWLRADPVALYAGLSTVYLSDQKTWPVDNRGCQAALEAVHALVQEQGLILHIPHPTRGYLQIPWDLELKTYAPDQVLNKAIGDYLPVGPDQIWCRRLSTEIQMLLHTGEGPANALWLWGGGRLPTRPQPVWQAVWCQNLLTQGLARLTGITSRVPSHLNDCRSLMQAEGRYLFVLDSSDLFGLETNWFMPLVSLLRQRQLLELRLYLGGKLYRVTSASIRYFWRRRLACL